MDRFSQGLPDRQVEEPVDYCEECGGEIFKGQQIWKVGSDSFCEKKCLLDNLQVVEMTAGEE